MISSATTTSGFSCAALSSIASCEQANARPSSTAPRMAAALRNVSGSCRLRADGSSHRYEPASRSRICALRRAMPGYGRAAATAGWRGEVLAAKRLPVERRADREGVQDAHGVGQRERGQAGAERVVVDQRDAFLGGQGHVAADAVCEIGERAEVALAGRAEQAHAGRLVRVERVDDARQELRAHARGALREPVGQAHHGGAHHLARRVRPGRHAVIPQQAPVVGVHLVGSDAHALAHADARGDAVDAVGALGRALDDRACGAHALERVGRHLDPLAASRDAHDFLEREPLAVQDHAHDQPVCRGRHPPGRDRRPDRPELPPAARRTMDGDA